jgi:hypothetical protein
MTVLYVMLTPKRDTRRNTADPVEGAPVKLTEYQILHDAA